MGFDLVAIVPGLLIMLLSLTVHEFCHAWVAYRLGDDTAHQMNRLTLDPRAHIDPFMTIVLPAILLILSGGRHSFGGAKPVPIDSRNFRNPALGLVLSSAAGPLGNLLLAAVGALVFRLLPATPALPDLWLDVNRGHALALNVVWFNIVLFVFNLVPIPPLDGSRILRHFLSIDGRDFMDRIEPYGIVIVGVLCFTTFGALLAPIELAILNLLLG